MSRILLFLFVSLFTISCGPRYVDYFPYHDDGTPKPQVALLPVIDVSSVNLPCNLSNDMTTSIRYEIRNSGELYLLSTEEINGALHHLGNIDSFDCDQAFAQQFCEANFIAVIEFVKQEVFPCIKEGMSLLKLSARIKIIDIRCKAPRVISQEIVSNDYLVCSAQLLCESEPYQASSIGKAHRAFAIITLRHV